MPQPPTTIPGPTPETAAISLARLGAVTGQNDEVADWIDVQFNPASLQLQVSNELKDTKNNERKQYIAKANAKLSMDLQFDTTDTGEDVTSTTRRLQAFIAPPMPPGQQTRPQSPPPVVVFEWGRLKFKGIAESYKETIDFFSANGVPLRSAVNLTLSQQEKVFDEAPSDAPDTAGPLDDDLALDTPPGSAADLANAAQAPDAARAVAAANGEEDLRFGSGAGLSLSAAITLKAPAAFSAGAGIGIGAGLGIGGGAGIGIGAGTDLGVGVSIGAGGGAGISGLSRLSASDGAFAGLNAAAASATASATRLNTSRLVPQVRSASLSTDRHASFQVGGKATVKGAAGLRADVGAGARLKFDL